MSKKLDANQVQALVANAGKGMLDAKELKELLERIRDLLPDSGEEKEKVPATKKQFVVLLSDPLRKMPEGEEFAAWVLQIPEEASPISTQERIEKAAYDFNASARGRKLPVQTVGETLESIPAKSLKEVELWCKTRMPVLVVVTNNEIPNTPGLFADDERGAKVEGLAYEVRTNGNVVRIDGDGINSTEKANVTTRDGRKVTPTAMLNEINAKFAEKLGIKKEGE